jgi:hypothetical protein
MLGLQFYIAQSDFYLFWCCCNFSYFFTAGVNRVVRWKLKCPFSLDVMLMNGVGDDGENLKGEIYLNGV